MWAKKYKLRTSTGLPFEFDKRRWQWDILNDLSPKQVWLKPPQIGASETTFIKAAYVAKKKNKDVIYTLPTQSDVQDMVSSKFNRIIAQNPILGEWTRDHDSIEQKNIGSNIIYFRGTFTTRQAMMVSSGLNVHDELDASDISVITQYQTRQEAQEREEDKWQWYFSHPSLSGHGVDIYWKQSDMKEWWIRCPHCSEEQVLTWPDNIDTERRLYVCSKCKCELSTEDRITGVWKNKEGVLWSGKVDSEYKFSGWHVSQMMLHNKDAGAIIDAFNDPMKDAQYFYNFVLGLPYVSGENRVEPAEILRNITSEVNTQEGPIVIGADTGHGLHFVCMNEQGIFYYDHDAKITATRTPYDRIRELLTSWPSSIAVFDQGGDLIGVRQLVKEFPGRVFLCYYVKDRKSVELVQWGKGDEWWKVKVDRNRTITLIVEQMRDIGRFRINGTHEEWEEFASHFGFIYREKIEAKDAKGKDDSTLYANDFVWKRNGPDHFVHALLYALVGMQRFVGERARVVSSQDFMGVPKAPFNNIADAPEVVSTIPTAAFDKLSEF